MSAYGLRRFHEVAFGSSALPSYVFHFHCLKRLGGRMFNITKAGCQGFHTVWFQSQPRLISDKGVCLGHTRPQSRPGIRSVTFGLTSGAPGARLTSGSPRNPEGPFGPHVGKEGDLQADGSAKDQPSCRGALVRIPAQNHR